MSHSNNDQGILRVIQSIALNRESGELEIISSRNVGTLRFSKGKLVDATLGMLSGFQAINAAISLRDVQLNFKPLTSAPRPSSIAPNERRVLQSFFGIEAADETDHVVEPPIDWNADPHQVVPLSEVDEVDPSDLQDIPIEVKPVVLPEVEEALAKPAVVRNEIPAESIIQSETRFVEEEPIPKMLTAQAEPENINGQEFLLPQSHRARRGRAEFLRRMPIAAVVLLLVIAAVAAITLIPKLSEHRRLASVPSTAAEQPSTDPQATTPANPGSAPNTRRPLEQAPSKSQTIPVAPQGTTPDSNQASVPNTRQPTEQTPSKSQTTPGAQQQTEASQTSPPLVAANRRSAFPKHEVQDLTGDWHVINTVDQTAYRSFQDMQIGFRLKIEQNGKDFRATGEKVSENGRPLPARSRTPIHVTGSIDGDNVVATFVEDGRARRTNGRFAWRLQDENAGLTGTFVTRAAKSSGKSAATREQ
ncbi:MAG TPA: hypothetical protein VIX17_10670 [Pyrinomonadaceae bacterium]